MRLLRHRTSLWCLALLAVAMQAALALAHAHAHRHRHMPVAAGGLETKAITFGKSRSTERPCAPSCPHDEEGSCAVCLSLVLAATGLPQPPPAFCFAPPHRQEVPPSRALALSRGDGTVHFQARAPPVILEA